MTYDEFTKNLRKAGITAKEFGLLLRKNPNSITNNKKTKRVPNELGVIAVLIRALDDNDVEYRSLIKGLDLAPRKIRGGAAVGKFGGDPQKKMAN